MERKIIYSKYHESAVVRDRMEYLPFERDIKCYEYIRDACYFADRWGIDVEVIEGEHRLEVHYFIRDRRIGGLQHLELHRLAGFSNAVEFPRRKSRPCNVEMILIWEE